MCVKWLRTCCTLFAFLINCVSSIVDLGEPFEKSQHYNDGSSATALQELALSLPSVRGYIVLKKGQVVAEYYKEGLDKTSVWPIFSCTKSWTTISIGMMIDEGLLSLNETFFDVWPDEDVWLNVEDSEVKKGMTLYSLITMSGGLYESEFMDMDTNIGEEDLGLNTALNYVRYDEDLVGVLKYLPAHSIWSYVILERTGMEPHAFAAKNIFPKLGIKSGEYEWWENGYNISYTTYGLEMNPTQLAKMGRLYQQRGLAAPGENGWIVSSDFIEESIDSQVLANDDEDWGSYGYMMWEYLVDGYCAVGLGGQYVCSWDDEDLVIAVLNNWEDEIEEMDGENFTASSQIVLTLASQLNFDFESASRAPKISLLFANFVALCFLFEPINYS